MEALPFPSIHLSSLHVPNNGSKGRSFSKHFHKGPGTPAYGPLSGSVRYTLWPRLLTAPLWGSCSRREAELSDVVSWDWCVTSFLAEPAW